MSTSPLTWPARQVARMMKDAGESIEPRVLMGFRDHEPGGFMVWGHRMAGGRRRNGEDVTSSSKAQADPEIPSAAGESGRPADKGRVGAETHLDPLITAAWLYYHHNFTQADIAKELNVSRATVANMLTKAKDDGLVTISLRPDLLSRLSLATQVRERFGLHDVYLVPAPEDMDESEVLRSLGTAAALYLENALHAGEVLGTAWGATMLEVARALKTISVEGLVVVQSLGSLNNGEGFNPIRVASLMAEKLGASVYHLYVPAVVESVDVKNILLRDRHIRAALEMARSASRLIIGIGKVSHDATVVRAGFIDNPTMDELRAKGAVGDLSGRYFDLSGRPVDTEVDTRIIGLTWDDLHRIRPVIAVAGGNDKAAPVLGAVRSGRVDVLITDERTARKVLALDVASKNASDGASP